MLLNFSLLKIVSRATLEPLVGQTQLASCMLDIVDLIVDLSLNVNLWYRIAFSMHCILLLFTRPLLPLTGIRGVKREPPFWVSKRSSIISAIAHLLFYVVAYFYTYLVFLINYNCS